jgi:ABC-type oligopeptide transport system substrate-binding subunit
MWPIRSALSVAALFGLAACDGEVPGDDADSLARIAVVEASAVGGDASAARLVAASTQIGLTAYEASGRVVPALAASWRVVDDGRTYVFKLRNAQWEDGRRMTAGDVVAVLRRVVAPGSENPMKPHLMIVENAAAIAVNRKPARMLGISDPRPDTVVITLTRAEPALLALLADPALTIARAQVPPPASGPFKISTVSGGRTQVVKNPQYFAVDRVSLDGALVEAMGMNAAISAFRAGAVDIVTGGTLDGLREARLVPNSSAVLQSEQSYGLYYYLARTSAGPLADIRVRRALAMVIDRRAILAGVFGNAGVQPAYGALPPSLPDAYAGSAADWAQWTPEARQAEAIRLLAEAGHSFERPLDIAVAIPRGAAHRDLLAAMTRYWGTIGIRVKAYSRAPDLHQKAIADGDFDLAVVERIPAAPLVSAYLAPFSCAVRAGGYCNPSVDELLENAAKQTDPGTRIQLERRANRLISEDAPLIAIATPIRWSLVSPRIGGWQNNFAGAHPLAALSVTGPRREK